MTKELRERLSELLQKEYPEICLVKEIMEKDWRYIEPEKLYAFIEQEIKEAERRGYSDGHHQGYKEGAMERL